MKKIIKICLLILVLLSAFYITAYAANYNGSCGDNVTWTLDTETGVLEISGSGAMKAYSNSGGPWYSYRSSVKTVTINTGVTSIGSYAFYDCNSLTSITIPDNVTSIGSNAFYYCTSLTSITIPDSVTSIGKSAFSSCTGLTSITIPDSVRSIGKSAFSSCRNIVNAVLGNGIRGISESVFSNCTALTSITIPGKVIQIEDNAFNNCSSLKTVNVIGSEEDWLNTDIKAGNEVLFSADVIFTIETEQTEPGAVKAVSIISKPRKTSYYIGDEIDHTGLVLKAEFSDGATRRITEGFTCSPVSTDTAGIKTVTVTYEGKETSFNIRVSDAPLPEDTPQLFVSSVKATVGSTVSVDVFIKNNPGFSYLEITPKYPAALTVSEVINGEIISDFSANKQYVWVADKNTTKNGKLMTVVFSVPNNAEADEYDIDYIIRGCIDQNEEYVELKVEKGAFSLLDFLYGDANGDGTIDGRDIVRLKNYIAEYDYDTGTSSVEIYGGADANGDGAVDGRDVIRLKRYIAAYDYETGTSSVTLGA